MVLLHTKNVNMHRVRIVIGEIATADDPVCLELLQNLPIEDACLVTFTNPFQKGHLLIKTFY